MADDTAQQPDNYAIAEVDGDRVAFVADTFLTVLEQFPAPCTDETIVLAMLVIALTYADKAGAAKPYDMVRASLQALEDNAERTDRDAAAAEQPINTKGGAA